MLVSAAVRKRHVFAVLLLLAASSALTAFGQTVPLATMAENAVTQSKLTLPGSNSFHLKAHIAEKDSPGSPYKADVEMFWVSPDKWRRTIQSPQFSQTLIVNGAQVSEQDSGDYYPFWLRDLVTAISDPLPMLDSLKQANSRVAKPRGSEQSTSCARFETHVGTPPAQISAFYVFCFAGDRGLLKYIVTPGYQAEFRDYKKFKDKWVARLLVTYPEPGTTLEARIVDLSELSTVDESLFKIDHPTPPEQQLKSVVVSNPVLSGMSLQNPPIAWPSVRSGKTSGALSIYVSVDRKGQVRETFPLNSDNAGLDDPVRRQVEKWRFKPAVSNGVPVQTEGILTFAFGTKIENPIPVLTDAEARKLATNTVEPHFPSGAAAPGTAVTIRVSLDTDGKLLGVDNPNNVPDALFLPANAALQQWHFRPYIRDGKPDLYKADITFHVP